MRGNVRELQWMMRKSRDVQLRVKIRHAGPSQPSKKGGMRRSTVIV